MGNSQYYAFNSAGQSIGSGGPIQVQIPSSITVGGNGNVLIGSTQFYANGITGIIDVNAVTGAYIKQIGPTTPGNSVAAFNSTDNKLYISSTQGTIQRTYNAVADVYPINSGFLPIPNGIVRFAPADTDIFLSPGVFHQYTPLTEIDRYDSSGNLLGTFVRAGSGGLGAIQDFTFGNGSLYVLSSSAGTVSLFQYDGTSGAFESVVTGLQGQYLQQLAYLSAPEPAYGAVAATGLVLVLAHRRQARRCF